MTLRTGLRDLPTASYIGFAAASAGLAGVLAITGKHLPYSFSRTTAAVESATMVLFGGAYLAAWLLLVVGALRPRNRFSLHGEGRARAVNVALASALLLALHLALGLALAAARS